MAFRSPPIRKAFCLVTALATVGAASACVEDTTEAGPGGDEITLVMPTEPDSLASEQAKTTSGYAVLRNVQEALLNRDPETNELVGELATSWTLEEPGRWRFILREGVTFHDGSPFNAEAAAYGLSRMWDPENTTILTSYLGPEMTFEVVDEYVLDVVTEEPDPILPLRLYVSPIPSMKALQEDPDSYPEAPVGTGPYRFVEWVRGQRIVMEENPDWWGHDSPDAGGEVTIPRATFAFRPEATVRASMLEAGEADFARWLTGEQCEAATTCKSSPGVETVFVRLDTSNPAMADIRVRQAIAYAINKERILDTILGGGTPGGQLVGESALGFNPDLAAYPYNPDRARSLIDEARSDGVPVDAELHVVARQAFIQRIDEIVQVIASSLGDVGLTVDTDLQEQVAFEEMLRARRPIEPDRGYIVVHSHGNELMDYSLSVNSYYRCNSVVGVHCDSELDSMHDEASQLVDDERDTALQELAQYVYDEYITVPIGQPSFHFGTADNLDWEPRLDGFILLKEMSFGG